MPVMGVSKFLHFFRVVASLDIDENDLKRYDEFVNRKLYDLLVRGEANAKANLRDVIAPHDLPITAGLQKSIHEYRRVNEEIDLAPILENLTRRPPLDLEYGVETETQLPLIAGGISVALAHTFKICEPTLKSPHSEHWERSFRIFDQLL
jgi:hypothetical protein